MTLDSSASTREGQELIVPVDHKPRLRGWLHAGMIPVVLVAFAVLLPMTPPSARLAVAVYGVSALLLFTVSATYHLFTWSPRTRVLLKRFDHANIFLIIAGSYTPFAVLLLDPGKSRILLWGIWTGAVAGVAFRVFWVGAPRWLYVPVYVAMGWTAVFFLPEFLSAGGAVVLTLIIAGGVLYSLGGVIYAIKRPNPWPGWFGFHEIFHACTLGGFLTQLIAVFLVVAAIP